MAMETLVEQVTDRPEAETTTQPRSLVAPSPILSLPCLLPALVTGGLLWLCYFPVACGWLGWVALVPLLCLVRSRDSAWLVYLSAWVSGLVFFVPVLQWMRVAHEMMFFAWLALAIYCALFIPLGIWLVRRLERGTRLPLIVTLPVVWTALDFFRAHFLTGFGWYFLGHTQHDFLPVIQISDLGGVYAVTFLLAAVNALIFELLYTQRWFRTLFHLTEPTTPRGLVAMVFQCCIVALGLAGSLGYGYSRLQHTEFATGPLVALVQGNVPQRVRNDAFSSGDSKGQAAKTMAEDCVRLSDEIARERPDLIVWPETSIPGTMRRILPDEHVEDLPPEWRKEIDEGNQLFEALTKAIVIVGRNPAYSSPS